MSAVIDGKLTISQSVRAEVEVSHNSHPTWSNDRRSATRPRGSKTHTQTQEEKAIFIGTTDADDSVRVNARIVTSVTIPFQKADGKPLDWIDPMNTRNFLSVAKAHHALKIASFKNAAGDSVPVYDSSTGMFTPGSGPHQYLEKHGVEVTARSTAAFIKAQLELSATVDPRHDKGLFQQERAEASAILGGR